MHFTADVSYSNELASLLVFFIAVGPISSYGVIKGVKNQIWTESLATDTFILNELDVSMAEAVIRIRPVGTSGLLTQQLPGGVLKAVIACRNKVFSARMNIDNYEITQG